MTLDPVDLDMLIDGARAWIVAQRARYRPSAQPLPLEVRKRLAPHFEAATLSRVRVARVPLVENPDFYAELDQVPMDLHDSAGITYGDTVLLSDRFVKGAPLAALLFHECVHVAQYSILGIPDFAHRYIAGWAENGFEYRRIPLEARAFELESRFAGGTLGDRSVEEIIRGGMGAP